MRAPVLALLLLAGCLSSTDELLDRTPTAADGAPDVAPDAGSADAGPDAGAPDVVMADTAPLADVGEADAPSVADVPDAGEPDAPDAAGSPDVAGDAADAGSDADAAPWSPAECDAGDEAWVKAAVQALLGRKPTGIREVRALIQLVEATDRQTVALALTRSQDFEDRWADWLMDELRINRVGDKAHGACYGPPLRPDDAGEVAAFVRANKPTAQLEGPAFNMTDVLRSSLRKDDLSPLFRAHLFAMMAKPITGANVEPLAMDMARRQDFGEIFEATYLDRGIVCAGCHNSEWSVTDDPDPALDRFWPVPGRFEQAIYGSSTGGPELAFYSAFRHLDVVLQGGGARPWKMDASCGRFQTAAGVPEDPAGWDVTFVAPLGKTASVWDVEAALRTGMAALADGGLDVDPETLAVPGDQALAYLVGAHVASRAWREVFGAPLVLVHHFPRNEAQRDILLEMTDRFASHGWSLRALLVAIVTHPLFNQRAPADGCGEHPYLLPAVVDPWTTAEPDETERGNGPGDVVHRASARVLLRMATAALEWPAPVAFPAAKEEGFQKAVGVFVKDGEPGFAGVDFQGMLAWEDRMAACDPAVLGTIGEAGSCVGHCDGQAPAGCWCDEPCVGYGDCCADFLEVCILKLPPDTTAVEDWVDALLDAVAEKAAATPEQTPTLRDVARALSDRLLTEPDLTPDQDAVLAALFGTASLEAAAVGVVELEARTRRVCGALLQTPQFWLEGLAAPDQQTEPGLVVAGETLQAACERWAPLVLEQPACGPGGLAAEEDP